MKKFKTKPIVKRLISVLLTLLMVLSTFPLTALAAVSDLGKVSGAKDINVSVSKHYGHELHTTTVNGTTYPLFCIEYGTTSPDSSYLEGKKAMASANAVEAAKWIFAGYYMEHGNSINWLDMAYCQKKVWAIMGDSVSWDFTDSGYDAWISNAKANMKKIETLPSFNATNVGTIVAGNSITVTDTNKVLADYPTFTNKDTTGVTITHKSGENKLTIAVDKSCTKTSFKISNGAYYKENTGDDDELLLYYPYGSKSYQKLIYSAYYDPVSMTLSGSITPLGNLKLVKTSEDGIVSGIKFTITGPNSYSKTATTNASGEIQLSDLVPGTYTVTEESIGRYETQQSKTVTVESNKTASVSFANVLKKGNIKIEKNSEDKLVQGMSFSIKGSDGKSYTANTNANGVATLTDLPVYDSSNNKISYTIAETSVPIRYYTPDNKVITLSNGGTSTVSITNNLKKGNIEIQKDCEDNKISGLTFSITGSDGSSYTATTNANGVAKVNNVPVYNSNNEKITYSVSETNVPIRYVTPDGKTVKLNTDSTSTLTFKNILKKFKVDVTKVDIENTKPQGDASLAGAVYGIYDGENLIDTYTTDENGEFTTKYYICGSNWSIREVKASEGYNLDLNIYNVGAEPKNYTVELNSKKMTVKEQVIKGNIAIIKHTDDGSTKIETPEAGAEFQIYLKSSGSYANAKASERDTIVCDQDGFASCKLLPYGVYTVHQTKGWDGREKIKDFDVFISKEGKTYKFLINNANFMSYLKVVKVDKETGKDIAYEGAAFEIYDDEGHRVTMQYTYPQVTSVHTFYTNSEGYLITPEKLAYGNYTLVEVQAPYGYVLDSTPIPFSINQESSSTDTGVTVVKVKAKDTPQKGVINITKSGEVLANFSDNENGIYTPHYEVQNLKGAVFEIYAGEDITTLDGTMRYQMGEKVDEITTSENGVATSKELYLGKYTIVEKTAPETFVNSGEQFDVELSYAGQNVSVTKTDLSVYNERQKVEVSLKKIMEENCLYGIGNNDEILSVIFGVYAAEKITASDGTEAPENALLSLAQCDKDGHITFDVDLPIGYKFYVKEYATDEHYILDKTRFEFTTECQDQYVPLVHIDINEHKEIVNKLIYGVLHGFKFDRETKAAIKGAIFGLFRTDTTEYDEDHAIVVAETDDDGNFEFKDIPYGDYAVREIQPAENYLPNTDVHFIHVESDGQEITIEKENDRIPELQTTATVDGEKECCATDVLTLVDTVEYKHLVPDKEYVLKGILMDKSTGKPLLIDGKEITSEVAFRPTEPCGTIDVMFHFDSRFIKEEMKIVAFESIYADEQELAVHADIDDEEQTVTVKIPNIKTSAKANGKKTVKAEGTIIIKDTVTYTNLTVGKEYVISGILMNKATGKPFKVDCSNVTAEVKFIPEKSNGTVEVEFSIDSNCIKKDTELVVFETLYRDGVEIAIHADIDDEGQTVKIEMPKPKTPKTGDRKVYGVLLDLGIVALGGCIAGVILKLKEKRKEDEA